MACDCANLSCSCESLTQSTETTVSIENPSKPYSFSYDLNSNSGPYYWHKNYPHCDGCKQSPIAISKYNSSKINGQLNFNNMNKRPCVCVLKNTGHTVMVSFCWLKNDPIPPSVTGGPLKNILYYFQHLIMHWGECNSEGSEHTLNGKRYPLEIQLVFYNSQYDSYETARENPQGLAILSLLCGIEHNAPKFPIKNYLRFLLFPGNRITIDEEFIFSLLDIINNLKWNYFSYYGSTTMPPCYENVQWILSNYIMPIDEDLLIKLRKLRSNRFEKIIQNYRPLQDINDREVYFYIR